jgi:hypothetical protein
VQVVHVAAFGAAPRIATATGLDVEQVAVALVCRPDAW